MYNVEAAGSFFQSSGSPRSQSSGVNREHVENEIGTSWIVLLSRCLQYRSTARGLCLSSSRHFVNMQMFNLFNDVTPN